jgi:ABC-type branched-subunit amino acid transport system substrate-binding protein
MSRNSHDSYSISRRGLIAGTISSVGLAALSGRAVGASSSEIKIGNLCAYSGPADIYAVLGKLADAYFNMINSEGGINGRKIKFISYDDAYSPPKTVEQARKLVESDEVELVFFPLGAPTNSAIMKYMNIKKVPQLFIASGATKFGDPKNFPWTMGFVLRYQGEGRAFAHNVLSTQPDARIGVLYQNDDFGRDLLKGFRDGLGEHASMIVKQIPYESTDPTIDGQILQLHAAGANVFMSMTTPKFAAQAIRKIAELG